VAGRAEGAVAHHKLLAVGKLSKSFPAGKFLSIKAKSEVRWVKNPHLGEFIGKIEIFSTHNLLCWKFAIVYPKITIFCPAYVFNVRRCYGKGGP